jgi:hypothetical protein
MDEKLRDHVRRLVDDAPPLTDAQRDRLRVLLRGPATTPPKRGK